MLQNHKKDWLGLLLGSKNQLPSENTVFVAHIFYFYTFEEIANIFWAHLVY